ncbi:MAG: DsrE family protein [Marinobacter sp.]|nr:DsrE family protein [Marinobacter sp.]
MHTLIVIDQPPYGSWGGRESLDMAFSLAAFDQPVSLLFIDAGVLWLSKGQKPAGIDQKSVERNLAAASIFGVEALLADTAACQRFGLTDDNLISGVTRVESTSKTLDQYQNVVFSG